MSRRKFTTAAMDEGHSLAEFVAERLAIDGAAASELVTAGSVYVDRSRVREPELVLGAGARVVVHLSEAAPFAGSLPVVFEDERCLVVIKPPGLPSQPGRDRDQSAEVLVRQYEPEARVVHRLDQDAHGLLLLGRTPDAHAEFRRWLDAGTFLRRYRAMVWGHPRAERGAVTRPVGPDPSDRRRQWTGSGKPARTEYVVVARGEISGQACSVVDFRLDTGRRHQIRVHMASMGHPVWGDRLYVRQVPATAGVPGLALCSTELSWPEGRAQLDPDEHFAALNFPGLANVLT